MKEGFAKYKRTFGIKSEGTNTVAQPDIQSINQVSEVRNRLHWHFLILVNNEMNNNDSMRVKCSVFLVNMTPALNQ